MARLKRRDLEGLRERLVAGERNLVDTYPDYPGRRLDALVAGKPIRLHGYEVERSNPRALLLLKRDGSLTEIAG